MTTPDPRITPAVLEAVRGAVGSPGRFPDADCARVAAAVLAALEAPPMTPPTADKAERELSETLGEIPLAPTEGGAHE